MPSSCIAIDDLTHSSPKPSIKSLRRRRLEQLLVGGGGERARRRHRNKRRRRPSPNFACLLLRVRSAPRNIWPQPSHARLHTTCHHRAWPRTAAHTTRTFSAPSQKGVHTICPSPSAARPNSPAGLQPPCNQLLPLVACCACRGEFRTPPRRWRASNGRDRDRGLNCPGDLQAGWRLQWKGARARRRAVRCRLRASFGSLAA